MFTTRSLFFLFVLASFAGCSADSVPGKTTPSVGANELTAIKALEAAGAVVKTDQQGSVTDIDLQGRSLQPETLRFLTELASLRVLNLADSSFDDQSLPVLEGISPGLLSLDLRGCQLSDKAPAIIARFTGLRVLRFNGKNGKTGISDDGVRSLAACASLKVLALDELTFVGSDGLNALIGLKELEELYVAGTIVDDHSCLIIADFPKLKKIRLARNQVSDSGLETLSTCSQLQELDLSEDSLLTDAAMPHLAKLTGLKKLNLWRVQVSDNGIRALAPLTNLVWLNLDNTKLSDAGLPALRNMKELTFLHLGSTQITQDGVSALFHLSKLKDLKITRSAMGSSDTAVAQLKQQLPHTNIQTEYVDTE